MDTPTSKPHVCTHMCTHSHTLCSVDMYTYSQIMHRDTQHNVVVVFYLHSIPRLHIGVHKPFEVKCNFREHSISFSIKINCSYTFRCLPREITLYCKFSYWKMQYLPWAKTYMQYIKWMSVWLIEGVDNMEEINHHNECFVYRYHDNCLRTQNHKLNNPIGVESHLTTW